MTTVTLKVGGLLSILGSRGIEKRLMRLKGVGHVSVNPVTSSTTVMFDPETIDSAAIQAAIKNCGFHCTGEAMPKHLCG